MKGFVRDIEELTDEKGDYRRVPDTGKHILLVLMSLAPDGVEKALRWKDH